MKKIILKHKKKFVVALLILLFLAILFGVLSWINKEKIIFDIIRDISVILTLSISLTMNFTLNINIDKSSNINVAGDLVTGESQEEKEINKAIKSINKSLLCLEELKCNLDMNHLKINMFNSDFIPQNQLKAELEKISLENLKQLNSELKSYKIIIENSKIRDIILELSENIENVINDIDQLKQAIINPMNMTANNYRKDIISFINNTIKKSNDALSES